MPHEIKNIKLASQGIKNIAWAQTQMGALAELGRRFSQQKPLAGITVGMALHITKETAALVRVLETGGARVAIASCNPLSTQDDVAAALAQEGVAVFGWKGETEREYYRNIEAVVQFIAKDSAGRSSPSIITIDDGNDLVSLIHTKYKELIPRIIGGAEETTTGINRLRAMERDGTLAYPMIAVNDSKTKHLMDNLIGTGQSTLDGIMRASSVLIAGKKFVVVGFGECGKGVALRAQGLGADVVVVEVDPFRALQAAMAGYEVKPISQAAKIGEIFVTVSGNKHVIRVEHIKQMKDGAILANAGHFDLEIDVAGLAKIARTKESIRPFMDRYQVDRKSIYLLGQGRLINLGAAEGHPSTIMAMSFANQALACEYLIKNQGKLEPKVYTLPQELDDQIARIQLKAMGIVIDRLTKEQKDYLGGWQEGT